MELGELEFKVEEFKSVVIPDYLKDQPMADVCNQILASCAEGFAEVCNRILREKLAKAPEVKLEHSNVSGWAWKGYMPGPLETGPWPHCARLVCIEEVGK